MAKSKGTGTGMRPSLRGFLAAALGKSRYAAAAMEDSCNNGSSSIGVWKGFSCTTSPRTKSFRCEGAPQMEKSCCQEDVVYRTVNSLYILSDLNTRTTAVSRSLHPLPEEEEEEEEENGDAEDPSFGCFAASSSGSSVVIDKVTIYEHDCVSSVCKGNSCSNSGKFLWKDKLCVVDVVGDEEEFSNSTNSMDPDLDLFTSSAGGSLYSSDVSSSESDRGCEFLAGLFRGLSSQRFFFCPDNSNSIMEQAKCKCLTKSAEEATSSSCRITEIDEQKQDQEQVQVQDQDLERQKLDISYFVGECSNSNSAETEEEEDAEMGDDASEKSGAAAAAGGGTGNRIIMEGSKALRLYSSNPYEDFRISMQEMVAAQGISDWCALQRLLQCYLNLNSRKTHEFILGAFIDLLKELISNTSSSDKFPLIDYSPPKG